MGKVVAKQSSLTVAAKQEADPCLQEVADPRLFAANVRAVMAERMGVPVTDCSYFDYLRFS